MSDNEPSIGEWLERVQRSKERMLKKQAYAQTKELGTTAAELAQKAGLLQSRQYMYANKKEKKKLRAQATTKDLRRYL